MQFLPDQMSDDKTILLDQYVRNVKHPCQFIRDQFNTILEEFVGVEQFVHPARKMVEVLQQQVQQSKQQIDSPATILNDDT